MSLEQASPNPYAEPTQATEPEPPRPGNQPKPAGTARRLAGGLMIANCVLLLMELALMPTTAASPSAHVTVVPAIFDFIVGVSLVSGSSKLAGLAIVRTGLGMTVGLALRSQAGAFAMGYQLVFCAALLGLLIGEAERVRTAIAGSVVGLCLVLEMVGLTQIVTGVNPLTPLLWTFSGDIEPSPVERFEGRNAPYSLSLPNKKWYFRRQELYAKENPLLDRWLVRPDLDAQLLIVTEHAPAAALPIDGYVDVILASAKSETPNLEVYSREAWRSYPHNGRIVKTRGTMDGVFQERTYAFVTTFGRAYYLVGLSSKEAFSSLEAELLTIFDSLKLPAAVLDAVSDDVDPAPIGEVRGLGVPYLLRAPNPLWHLRKQDVVKSDNPIIDRWLTRSDAGAHVFVVAEQADAGVELKLPAYVDAVLGSVKGGASRFDVLSRKPWTKFPADGMRVRVSVTRNGADLEYDYALHARGNRAFQVIGSAPTKGFATAVDDIDRVIDSFELPP